MGGLTTGTKGAAEDRLALLWRRVKEHRIAQWTAGYVAVAYGIQHGVTLTADAYDWPHSITRVSITLLALGKALNATHLIEGTIRKAGDQLRISAQLVRADTGVTLWANSYDRELKDVFAVQEDIARSIASSLHMTLSLKAGDSLVSDRLSDPKAHELYLRALAAYRNRGGGNQGAAPTLVKQLVAQAPDFAPGWALQGMILGGALLNAANPVNLSKDAEASARKAIAFDPNLALSYDALAIALAQQRKYAEAIVSIKQAHALDSDDPDVLDDYRNFLGSLGYLRQALDVSERLSAIEPQVPLYARITGVVRMANGQVDSGTNELNAAYRMLFAGSRVGGFRFSAYLATAYAQQGRLNDAADILLADPSRLGTGPYKRSLFEAAAQILRSAAKKEKPPAVLPEFDSELNFAYIYAGAPERMLDWPEKAAKNGDRIAFGPFWWPMPSSVRKTERFKKLLRDVGAVETWRQNGWPDLCHPTTGDDFECS
jgi:tetratricopeptide (TPR) repeat protein